MKKKKQKTKEQLSPMRKKISAMLTLQTFFVVLIVVVVAGAIALMYRVAITDMLTTGVLSVLVPVVLLVTLVNFLFTRYIYRYLDKISDAMQKVADGDYTVRLDAEKDQPFRELLRTETIPCASTRKRTSLSASCTATSTRWRKSWAVWKC